MIIFGTKARHKVIASGEFNCPHCGKVREYDHKHGKNYFAVYFIPIFPIGDEGEFIECRSCQRTYALDVLNFKPARPQHDVAKLLNSVRYRLEQGYPIEYVISDLTAEGIERDIAHNMIQMAAGDARRVCPKCDLTYADFVDKCPDCQLALVAR